MAAQRWKDLRLRLVSALVMVPVALGAILAGGLVWQLVLGVLAGGGVVEWAMLCGVRLRSVPQPRVWATGTVYILLAWAALAFLRAGPGGAANVLFVMVTVFGGDVGAYLAGRLLGGPKLAPGVSPGKTWSGAVGGVVAGLAAGLLVATLFGAGPHDRFSALCLAFCLCVVAQGGDLLESAMKRRFGKKDSSSLIPGHGGLLDRLDGLLAAAPVAALWLAVRQGVVLWQ